MIAFDILMFIGLFVWTVFVSYATWKVANFINELKK